MTLVQSSLIYEWVKTKKTIFQYKKIKSTIYTEGMTIVQITCLLYSVINIEKQNKIFGKSSRVFLYLNVKRNIVTNEIMRKTKGIFRNFTG